MSSRSDIWIGGSRAADALIQRLGRLKFRELRRQGLGLSEIVDLYGEVGEVSPDEVILDDGQAPSEDLLRERFGLTQAEAGVARLLAAGKSNAEIALSLFISPHTARHHTERVLAKMGIHSRAEVAMTILSA